MPARVLRTSEPRALGDIVWQREGIEIPTERPWLMRKIADKDEQTVRNVVARLHQLAKAHPKLVIVPAHDERVWDQLPTLAQRSTPASSR